MQQAYELAQPLPWLKPRAYPLNNDGLRDVGGPPVAHIQVYGGEMPHQILCLDALRRDVGRVQLAGNLRQLRDGTRLDRMSDPEASSLKVANISCSPADALLSVHTSMRMSHKPRLDARNLKPNMRLQVLVETYISVSPLLRLTGTCMAKFVYHMDFPKWTVTPEVLRRVKGQPARSVPAARDNPRRPPLASPPPNRSRCINQVNQEARTSSEDALVSHNLSCHPASCCFYGELHIRSVQHDETEAHHCRAECLGLGGAELGIRFRVHNNLLKPK